MMVYSVAMEKNLEAMIELTGLQAVQKLIEKRIEELMKPAVSQAKLDALARARAARASNRK
jgi:hypothetical protein